MSILSLPISQSFIIERNSGTDNFSLRELSSEERTDRFGSALTIDLSDLLESGASQNRRDPAQDIPTVEQQLRQIQRNVQSSGFIANSNEPVNAVFRIDGEIVGVETDDEISFSGAASDFVNGEGRGPLESEFRELIDLTRDILDQLTRPNAERDYIRSGELSSQLIETRTRISEIGAEIADQASRDREQGIPVGARDLARLQAEFGDRLTVERFDLPEQQEEGGIDSRPRRSDFIERVTAEDIANDQQLIDLLTRERETRVARAREQAGFAPDGTPPPTRGERFIQQYTSFGSLLNLQEVE